MVACGNRKRRSAVREPRRCAVPHEAPPRRGATAGRLGRPAHV